MIEFSDTSPDVNVEPAEYYRLLGYPPGRLPEGRALELAEAARAWYSKHGQPWVYARGVERDDVIFRSVAPKSTFDDADAHAAVLVAVSAGPQLEYEAARRWKEEKPDEYFFLEMFGSAVVEHLSTMTGARLCAWAEPQRQAVLP